LPGVVGICGEAVGVAARHGRCAAGTQSP